MTSAPPGLSGAAAAALLRERKVEIIQRWRQRVLREVYAAGEQDTPSLLDSLPEFLELLVLRLDEPFPSNDEYAQRVAEKHGEMRAELPEYTLGQVITEYQVLREVLVDLLERQERMGAEPLRRLHVVIDQGIRVASVRFVEHSRQELGRAERSTQLLERLLDQIFTNFTGAMAYFAGADFVYERVNAGYREILNGRELVGQPLMKAVPELATSDFPALLRRVYETGGTAFVSEGRVDLVEPRSGQVQVRYFDGSYSRIEDPEGRPMGIFHFATEVTERVAARQESERAARELRISVQRQAQAFEVLGAGVWELNLVTQEVVANTRFREMFGLTPEESFGLDKGLAIIHPEDRPTVATAVSAAIAGENGGRFEEDYRTLPREDGSYLWVASRGQAYFDDQGKALRFLGTGIDITARREMEAFLVRQSRLHALNAQVGLALSRGHSLREMLQWCARALVEQLRADFARIWLFDPEQNVLVLHADAGPPSHPEGLQGRLPMDEGPMGRIARERKPQLSNQAARELPLGAREWAGCEGMTAFAGQPLRVGDKLVGVVALFSRQPLAQDTLDVLGTVADSIALGAERRRAEDELKTRVDFEQQLIGIVSHDLRNPLTAILMGASLLARREDLDERTLRSLMRIHSAADRATRMVKDLLDFTQARLGGGLRIERRPADLHLITRGVVEEVEAAWPGRELEVRHEGDGRGAWDADRLAQVVQNLVTNALKYSPEGTPVQVSTRAEDGEVSLSVANQGPPIAPDKLASLFEPLQRATAELDKAGRSVGLGLYIVKRIVDAHGGRVGVSSTSREGTRFTVWLPRQERTPG